MLRAATGSTKDQGCLEVRNMSMCNQQCFIKEKKMVKYEFKKHNTELQHNRNCHTHLYIFMCRLFNINMKNRHDTNI